LVVTERKPPAHATGIEYVSPPGLNPNNLNLYFAWFKSGTASKPIGEHCLTRMEIGLVFIRVIRAIRGSPTSVDRSCVALARKQSRKTIFAGGYSAKRSCDKNMGWVTYFFAMERKLWANS
jgi:hypothetical protein